MRYKLTACGREISGFLSYEEAEKAAQGSMFDWTILPDTGEYLKYKHTKMYVRFKQVKKEN
jgi:hypothetical protein